MTPAERNIRLLVEYQGTAYAGWQMQLGQRTIQGDIVVAIEKVTGSAVNLLAAGRTDTGVHALGQVANFKITHELSAERFAPAINYYLDDDIRIQKSESVALGFHARFDAVSRRYRYLLSEQPSAIYRNLRWNHQEPLDLALLQRAAEMIVGRHDFTPFCVKSSRKPNNTCQIDYACWRRIGPLLVFEIRGNRFLHSMVRSLVGAMTNLARSQPDDNNLNLTLADFGNIIKSSTEERVVFTAPAHGLYFVSVNYNKGT